jgi:thiol-disulfide isomerase/thioredoxin
VKTLALCLLLTFNVLANNGKMLFEKHCASCHTPFIPMLKLKENFLDHNNTLLKLKAPTLNQLSYRLKQRIGDPKGDEDIHRMEVTAFMSDYVYHPDKSKSVCLDEVMIHFKTMPSLKGKVSEEALESIGEYLYDFDEEVVKAKGVKFEGFDEALLRAKKENKLIMIEAMTSTCHFCRKMEREVLIDTEIVRAIQKDFVPVAIDINKHMLPLGIKVDATPSFIFIDIHKNILLNVAGAWEKEDFLDLLKEAKIKSKKEK